MATYENEENFDAPVADTGNNFWQIGFWIFLALFLLVTGYLIYGEIKQPLFGKWPKIKAEKEMLAQQRDSLLQEVAQLQKENRLLSEQVPPMDGLFFVVQIGAFRYFNIRKYNEDLTKLGVYQGSDDLTKYTLGKFRKYKTATAFRRDLQRLGLHDAFIVPMQDGQRVDNINKVLNDQKIREAAGK